jgi:hypothetical protein
VVSAKGQLFAAELKKEAVVTHRCHRIRAQQQHNFMMLRVQHCNWYHLSPITV